jgi:hypothetical protein
VEGDWGDWTLKPERVGNSASTLSPSSSAPIAVFWYTFKPLYDAVFTLTPLSIVLSLFGLTAVHELLHAAAQPMAGRSSHSILGFWPSWLVFYAHYDGELHRNRFVVIALMPLFVLSILPLLVSAATQSVAGWVASISSFNALTAGVDLLATGIIVFQIPARAILHNQGWKTYWREPVPLHVS